MSLDHGQHIVEIVGDPTCEESNRLQFLGLLQLLLQAPTLCHVAYGRESTRLTGEVDQGGRRLIDPLSATLRRHPELHFPRLSLRRELPCEILDGFRSHVRCEVIDQTTDRVGSGTDARELDPGRVAFDDHPIPEPRDEHRVRVIVEHPEEPLFTFPARLLRLYTHDRRSQDLGRELKRRNLFVTPALRVAEGFEALVTDGDTAALKRNRKPGTDSLLGKEGTLAFGLGRKLVQFPDHRDLAGQVSLGRPGEHLSCAGESDLDERIHPATVLCPNVGGDLLALGIHHPQDRALSAGQPSDGADGLGELLVVDDAADVSQPMGELQEAGLELLG